jgi:hypothetical protein
VGAVVVLDVEDMKECNLIHPVDGLRVPVRVKALIAGSWSWRMVGRICLVAWGGCGCGARVVQGPAGWMCSGGAWMAWVVWRGGVVVGVDPTSAFLCAQAFVSEHSLVQKLAHVRNPNALLAALQDPDRYDAVRIGMAEKAGQEVETKTLAVDDSGTIIVAET